MAIVALTVGGCAMPGTVQRITVDYNTAIAGMANEVTFLNIIRAKDGLPTHYTSISRLSGSVAIKTTGSLAGTLKQTTPTIANTIAAGVETATGVSNAKGGDTLTPTVGGEIDTGPSFDLNILESQAFYQGILSPIPFSTIDNFLSQGYDGDVLMAMLGERIEFQVLKPAPGIAKTVGATVLAFDASDDRFQKVLNCYQLSGVTAPPKVLVPVGRITKDASGAPQAIKLADLASLDGQKLDLDASITGDPAQDVNVNIVRPAATKRVVKLTRRDSCIAAEQAALANGIKMLAPAAPGVVVPAAPPPQEDYLGAGKVLVSTDDFKGGQIVDTSMSVIFRSTEGLVQYLGACLHKAELKGPITCRVGEQVIFAIKSGDAPDAAVRTKLLGHRYYVAKDDDMRPTMRTLALVEQLINLQQSSTSSPATVPVQIIP